MCILLSSLAILGVTIFALLRPLHTLTEDMDTVQQLDTDPSGAFSSLESSIITEVDALVCALQANDLRHIPPSRSTFPARL